MGLFDFLKGKKKEVVEVEPLPLPKGSGFAPSQPVKPFVPYPDAPKPVEAPKEKGFQQYLDGKKAKYFYNQVKVFTPKDLAVDFVHMDPGVDIQLKQEPENAYDGEAVAVYTAGTKLGYLYKGKIKDMVNDYIGRGWPILGCVDMIDDDEGVCAVTLVFYTEEKHEVLGVYKLAGTGGAKAQDEIMTLAEGDILTVVEDYEKGRYDVLNFMGEKVGYLPKTANKAAEGEADFVVDRLEIDDNLKTVVYLRAEIEK